MKRIDPMSVAERSRQMATVKSKDSTAEMFVRRLVHRMGFRYRLHDSRLPGTPDLVFPSARKVIFVSGCFWHMHHCGRCRIPVGNRDYWIAKLERNRSRDRRVRKELRQLGWQILTVWECQLRSRALEERLSKFLGQKQPPIR